MIYIKVVDRYQKRESKRVWYLLCCFDVLPIPLLLSLSLSISFSLTLSLLPSLLPFYRFTVLPLFTAKNIESVVEMMVNRLSALVDGKTVNRGFSRVVQ